MISYDAPSFIKWCQFICWCVLCGCAKYISSVYCNNNKCQWYILLRKSLSLSPFSPFIYSTFLYSSLLSYHFLCYVKLTPSPSPPLPSLFFTCLLSSFPSPISALFLQGILLSIIFSISSLFLLLFIYRLLIDTIRTPTVSFSSYPPGLVV